MNPLIAQLWLKIVSQLIFYKDGFSINPRKVDIPLNKVKEDNGLFVSYSQRSQF